MTIQDHSGIAETSLEEPVKAPVVKAPVVPTGEAEETNGDGVQPELSATVNHQEPDGGEALVETKESVVTELDTLEETLKVNEQVVTYTKSQKYPESESDDVVVDDSGKSVIKAQHVLDDIEALFGDKPNPKLYFAIFKNSPKKAEQIAKATGHWKTKHHMKASIESFVSAKSQDERDKVLKEEFPDFAYNSDVDKPFEVDIQKELKGKTIESASKNGKLAWSNDDIDKALDGIVSDNPKLNKDELLKAKGLSKILVEFSALRQEDGKPLDAKVALELAFAKAGIREPEGNIIPRSGSAKGKKGVKSGTAISAETIALAKSLGRMDLIQ